MQILRSELGKLARTPERLRWPRLWRALSPSEREFAVGGCLRDDEGDLRSLLIEDIAAENNFRQPTIERKSAERLAEMGARLKRANQPLIIASLRALHMDGRRELLCRFLDELEVGHDRGVITPESALEPFSSSKLEDACRVLLENFTIDFVATYFLVLLLQDGTLWAGLADVVKDLAANFSESAAETDTHDDGVVEAEEADDEWIADDFTTLDRFVVKLIVDVIQGVEGAPNVEQLDDIVDELVQLNSTRHRSYFHVGLRDVVLARPLGQQIPAENISRRRWYFAGAVQGLARSERWADIGTLYDAQEIVQGLGDTGTGPSMAGTPHVFDALCKLDRPVRQQRSSSVQRLRD